MSDQKVIIVAGGSGFIGSHFVRLCLREGYKVLNYDALTYAASPSSLKDLDANENYHFEKGYIQDAKQVSDILGRYKPVYVVNFAAETHVDRSIEAPSQFIESNVLGSFTLLNETRRYHGSLSESQQAQFRFLHISTDEVFGSCDGEPYSESASYNPSSPYSSSKAAADLIIRSYFHTYNFPVLITNCTNNYGPYQFPEKLIPHMIVKALQGQPLPIYGSGNQIRDWLYVEDHVEAILKVLTDGSLGETYNIAGLNGEMTNKTVVERICEIMDSDCPRQDKSSYNSLIKYVTDRPGHDFRYALSIDKIKKDLNWSPSVSFEQGISKTVHWYLENKWWWEEILSKGYDTKRMGLKAS